jgi:hypothetical protein
MKFELKLAPDGGVDGRERRTRYGHGIRRIENFRQSPFEQRQLRQDGLLGVRRVLPQEFRELAAIPANRAMHGRMGGDEFLAEGHKNVIAEHRV